jgi:replicative DNA helicase
MYILPKSSVGSRDTNPDPVDEGLRMVARETTMQLLRLGASIDPEGQEFLVFSDEARRTFDDFAKWLEPQLAPGQPLSSTYGWGGKLAGLVARIAGVLHLMDTVGHDAPWEEPITSDVVERAIVIGRYLIEHALAAFGVMKASPEMENAQHVVKWLKTKQIKEFGRPDAHKALEHHFKSVEDLKPILDFLEEYGYVWMCNKELLIKARDAARQMMAEVEATLSWVPRTQNERADELSRQAYREELARGINPNAEAYARQKALYAYNRQRGD